MFGCIHFYAALTHVHDGFVTKIAIFYYKSRYTLLCCVNIHSIETKIKYSLRTNRNTHTERESYGNIYRYLFILVKQLQSAFVCTYSKICLLYFSFIEVKFSVEVDFKPKLIYKVKFILYLYIMKCDL